MQPHISLHNISDGDLCAEQLLSASLGLQYTDYSPQSWYWLQRSMLRTVNAIYLLTKSELLRKHAERQFVQCHKCVSHAFKMRPSFQRDRMNCRRINVVVNVVFVDLRFAPACCRVIPWPLKALNCFI